MSHSTFQYLAVDHRGSRAKGRLQATDRTEAYRKIIAAGMKPVKISSRRTRTRRRRVTAKDLSHLTHQFAVLLEARIPIVEGLRAIADQEQHHRLREVLEDVARQIEGGTSISAALTPYREVFGEVYVETLRAGELSGNMIDVLKQLAEMLERRDEMMKRLKAAVMYPICVVATLSLAVIFLMTFVVPRFATIFASRGVELPFLTKVLIAGGNVVQSYWYLIAAGTVGLMWCVRRAWRRPESRRRLDTALHRVPLVREILRGVAITRFTSVFSISLRSGLSLIDALEISGRASGRPLLLADAEKMREQVNLGGKLTDVLVTCMYLPAFARRMLSAGEDSGEMSKMCEIVSRHYDREVTHFTKSIGTLIEPVMIVGLAGVVLIVALAIFIPMWNMASLMS